MKAFAWSIVKKSQRPKWLNAETGPGDKWHSNFKKSNNVTNRKPNNILLIMVDPRMANIAVYKQHVNLLEKITNDLEPDKED